ncbi:hypothetical protein ONS95_003378 [Cadophora gregata]|uniref:uncharacterized protein n=1 Tax=Cadophora gregata TaxID=51156 RepID=UPI0026DBFF45|nr:uncharacterized protein ONS95_003378 [Cadophora gregata]KAK0108581.1 hypothetical protein ONS95_003378 [Cadophora gregata]KAK0108826.1 hypothetical protein ONS96_002668 [Cadophora gregata f. sp. sojae]
MVAISASLTSAIMALLITSITAAPAVLEARADERLAITFYKEAGSQKCFNPITDHPEFPGGIFRPKKGDVNEKCYANVSFNSFGIYYVQDSKRGCRVEAYSSPVCAPGSLVARSGTEGCTEAVGAKSFYVLCENNDGA